MKKIGVAFLMFLLCTSVTYAQKNYKKEADNAFSGGKFYQAIDMYKKAYAKEKNGGVKSEILYQIAESYRLKEDAKQALVWYNKAVSAKHAEPMLHKRVAEILKSQGNYEDAIVNFNKYASASSQDVSKDGEACKKAKEWKDNPTRYMVNPKPLINSEYYDFSPVFADKKNQMLYFTSTRQGSTGAEVSGVTGMNFSDIYWTKVDKKGKWSEPALLNDAVNSGASEGAVSINARKNVLYFTRCGVEKNGIMGCQIYWAKKQGVNWGQPTVIPFTEDTFAVGHPAISKDDQIMVFSSDMAGGKGGKDLWYATYDKKQKTYINPTNLGSVNTPGDEMFPFIRDNGDLYFASNGHSGMGGLDIFMAKSKSVSSWGEVSNLEAPINSSSNDFGITFEPGKDRGYFTTSREGGKGGDDIWEFYMPPMMFSLDGVVKDLKTDEPISGAKVVLVTAEGETFVKNTDATGNFSFVENGAERFINPEKTYSIVVEKEKYLKAKGKETTVGLTKSKKFFHEYSLQPMQGAIKLPQILYEYNKADLLAESKDSLNFLYNIMIDNPKIVIELRSHTDYRGSDKYNQSLSQKRAQACVDYLVGEKGVNPARVLAKGMGETEPLRTKGGVLDEKYINGLATEEEQEYAHQQNRRTDFKVVRDDFVPSTPGN